MTTTDTTHNLGLSQSGTQRSVGLVVCLMLIAALCPALAVAQRQPPVKNLPYYDQRLLHWGFCLGLNMNDITLLNSGAPEAEGWKATCPDLNAAFLVGLMGDLAITEHLNVRVAPTLYFQQRNVAFERYHIPTAEELEVDASLIEGTQRTTQQLKTIYLELPVSLKISTRRINNYRPYLVAGAQVAWDFSHEKETPIVFNRFDVGLHIGMGCDCYLPFFKFAPELRFHLGLRDMLDHERKDLEDATMMPYTHAVTSARNIGMSLIFWFE